MKRMDAASVCFGSKDLVGALAELERASDLRGRSPRLLNLRGSCRVELRDFESALADFRQAEELAPHDPAIRVNIAEVLFVTRRWEESLAEFVSLRDDLADPTLLALAEFKILLCNEALGRDEDFLAGIMARRNDAPSPSLYYTRAAAAFHAGAPDEARQQLAAAKQRFPNPQTLAPWIDTLIEFGWLGGDGAER